MHVMTHWFEKLRDCAKGNAVLGLGTLGCLDVSPAGRILATGGSVGVVLWNYEERRVIRRFAAKLAPIVALTFSADGQRIVALGRSGALGVFDINNGECLISEELDNPDGEPWTNDPAPRMQFDPVGTDVLVMMESSAWLLNQRGAESLTGDEESAFEEGIVAGFSSAGEIVVLGEEGVAFYKRNAKKKGFKKAREIALDVGGESPSVSPDGKYLFAENLDGKKGGHVIASLETGEILWQKRYGDTVYGAQFAWRAPVAYVNAYKGAGVVTFPPRLGAQAPALKNDGKLKDDGVFPQWAIGPDGDFAIAGDSYHGDLSFHGLDGGEPFADLGRYIYESDSALTLFAVDENAERCVMMGFIGDGQNSSGWAQSWSLKEDRPLEVLDDSVSLFCSNICAIAGTDEVVIPLDRSGVCVVGGASKKRVMMAHDDGFQNVTVGREGQVIAAGSVNGQLVLWERKTGKVLVDIRAHRDQICGIGWQPHGDVLVTTSQDGIVKLWSANALLSGEKAQPRAEVDVGDMLYQVAFSADGALCAVGTAETGATVIDTRTGKLVIQLEATGGEIMALAFHPVSGELVTGSLDGSLSIWDVSRSAPIVELSLGESDDECDEEGMNGVTGVAFDGRGKILLASQRNGIIRRWDLG